ncbi:MAG TPA: uL15 family ribosomal protein [Methanomassiliicoccales archaeon]|jgi:large subunit ribosomal protein L15|nr:uL15 family ribosomal protein [Methanomassiliicoccales archaeon]MCE5261058.1 50S ribosomal protein L15 [Euryarchaeota archaeon]HOE53047.1 uL15 family ribosomal protein [Methanomassiliicoccales archaeon]HOO03190.1 uL15 family ribosomal protein [Methanomassiliicoccales archaeon]HQM66236.1 uL15 family ribosomal protein [Methanomassiliicoccales archaeon]
MVSRTEKFRGSRTHGRGKKSGRGAGKHGGKGNAGLHKHKAQYMLKYMPDHFGRHGFKRPQKTVSAKITMNVGDLEQTLQVMKAQGTAVERDGKISIDLGALGVDKLLGNGQVSTPFVVSVAEATALAKAKVEKAGGHIVVPE